MALIWSSFRRKFGILVVARKSVGFFSQTGIQFLLSLRRTSFRFGPIFFTSCSKALGGAIELDDPQVELAVGHSQRHGADR